MWKAFSVIILGLMLAAALALGTQGTRSNVEPQERAEFLAVESRNGLDIQASVKAGSDLNMTLVVAGIPGAPNPSPNLTDSLALVKIESREGAARIRVLSIPRDLYIDINGGFSKINGVYEYHLPDKFRAMSGLKEVLERVTGASIDHVAVIDLNVIKTAVDAVGGVNVPLESSLDDPAYPGANFSYEPFSVSRGWRYLDGETAVKFIRTRVTQGGDFDRMRRQQILIGALKAKLENSDLLHDLPRILELMRGVEAHVVSTIGIGDAPGLLEAARNLKLDDVAVKVLEQSKEPALVVTDYIRTRSGRVAIVRPSAGIGEYGAIHSFVRDFFGNDQ